MSLRSRLAVLGTLALVAPTAALITTPAHAAGGVTITSVSPGKEWGGLSGFIQMGCSVRVAFTDTTPSAETKYTVSLVAKDGRVITSAQPWAESKTKFTVGLDCQTSDFVDGQPVTVQVKESSTVTAKAWTPDTLKSPVPKKSRLTLEKQADGSALATLTYGGEWEEGLTYSYKVWTSKSKEFTGDDWEENQDGSAAVVKETEASTPLTSFRVPKHLLKRYMWVSVVARGTAAQFDEGVFWGPSLLNAPKTMPKAWVKSYGKKRGVAKVGKRVRVTAPKFSSSGKAAKPKVSYRWFSGKKAIKGAKKSKYKITRSRKGKKLSVVVTVRKGGYVSRTKRISFGKVR